jgi:molybdopterin-guanine dinucleotide biosynthesis protein A
MIGPILGVVLAGGASHRFDGAPKGLQLLSGKALALHAAEALRELCKEIVVEAAPGAGYEALNLPLCAAAPDHAGKGPVAGMVAGLSYAASCGVDAAAFIACDMPFVPLAHFQRLAAALDDAHAAYAITPDGAEPLVAIVKTNALADLERALVREKIERTHIVLDRTGATGVWFADPAPFRNINTRADLAHAQSGSPIIGLPPRLHRPGDT